MKKMIILMFALVLVFVFATFNVAIAGESLSSSSNSNACATIGIAQVQASSPDKNEILKIKLSKEAIETSERALSFILKSGGFNDMFKEECREAFYVLKHEAAKKKFKTDKLVLVVELSRKNMKTIQSALYFILGGKDAQDATNEISFQIALHDGSSNWTKIINAEIRPGYHSVGVDIVPVKNPK